MKMCFFVLLSALASAQKEDEEKKEGLPLPVAETLEFEVDEGTWMSLDVSPDGKTLVFDLLGDIYTLPMQGGEATRFEAATLDQIWPIKKPLPKQFWWDDVPAPSSTTNGGAR